MTTDDRNIVFLVFFPLTFSVLCNSQVDCQERGLRESDWNDPIDSREEGTQKYASKSANAAAAASAAAAKVIITSAEITAVLSAPIKAASNTVVKKGSNAKVKFHFYFYSYEFSLSYFVLFF